jgi:hypothetical protein
MDIFQESARRRKQRERAKKFPQDRIAFLSSTADLDKAVLRDWYEHGRWRQGESRKICKERAMKAIAENNLLDSITEVQFDNLVRITGWFGNDS